MIDQMRNGILIRCPKCQQKGVSEILARVTDDMNVIVRRRNKWELTSIQSENYILKCSCGALVFKRDNDGTAYL